MQFFRCFHRISNFFNVGRTYRAKVAIYSSLSTPPEIKEIKSTNLSKFLQELAGQTHALHQNSGGTLPYIAIKEVIDNLVHAKCRGVIITILPNGEGIRVADQGPGITKVAAVQPGFSSASRAFSPTIRAVGSGLTIASETVKSVGGKLLIDDNIQGGTVVSLILAPVAATQELVTSSGKPEGAAFSHGENYTNDNSVEQAWEKLSQRQLKILQALAEYGALGPSKIAELISTSPSSAYRDLVSLGELGIVEQVEGGKRQIKPSIQQIVKTNLQTLGDK